MSAETFYDTDRALSEYLLFHYGEDGELLPYDFGPGAALDFPGRCVTECLDVPGLPPNARALDLGCAVGRSTFELARHCGEVLGIDFSARFIACAERIRAAGEVAYTCRVEGDVVNQATARLPAGVDATRVRFEQGDAMDLRDHLGQFDVLLLANLVDRLADPARCLARLSGLVNPGGQLIITTPGTWLVEFTPKERWLGGHYRDGQAVSTLDGLRARLDKDFELRTTKDLPFLIREHARKFQWSVAQASIWRRR